MTLLCGIYVFHLYCTWFRTINHQTWSVATHFGIGWSFKQFLWNVGKLMSTRLWLSLLWLYFLKTPMRIVAVVWLKGGCLHGSVIVLVLVSRSLSFSPWCKFYGRFACDRLSNESYVFRNGTFDILSGAMHHVKVVDHLWSSYISVVVFHIQ